MLPESLVILSGGARGPLSPSSSLEVSSSASGVDATWVSSLISKSVPRNSLSVGSGWLCSGNIELVDIDVDLDTCDYVDAMVHE